MEQGTMIGTILGFTLLLIAMCFDFTTFQVNVGNLAYFIDIPSLLIVVGGTVAFSSIPLFFVVQSFWSMADFLCFFFSMIQFTNLNLV